MCGIVGYSGEDVMSEAELKILLYFAEERGDDSCGVATPKTILKKAEDPHVFIQRKLPVDTTVLGHTRAKTTGAIIDKNSHPFKQGKFVGIHNGVITNFRELQREEDTSFDVDSEIIWYLFDKYGYKEALPKLKGWMALAWIDEKGRLNLYRHRGPLVIGKKDGSVYFASKEEYLEAIDCDHIQEIDQWYRYIFRDGKLLTRINMNDCKPQSVTTKRKKKENKSKAGGGQQYEHGSWLWNEDQRKLLADGRERPSSVPSYADYIRSNSMEATGYYYWRGVNDTTKLFIQPVSEQINYLPAVEEFQLTNSRDVFSLVQDFTDVYELTEIKNSIPEHLH